jgi:polyhydroxyalkanoate synthesis regulator phasin
MFEASKTLYEMNGDETIRAQCRAREDYEYRQKMIQHKMAELTSDNLALQAEKATLQTEVEILNSEVGNLNSEVGKLRLLLAEHGIKDSQ